MHHQRSCACERCGKLAALAARPWTWDDDLALSELQRRRRESPVRGIGSMLALADHGGTIPSGGLL